MPLNRKIALVKNQTAVLFIDVQNFVAHREGAEFKGLTDFEFETKYGWFHKKLHDETIPNMQQILKAFRAHKIGIVNLRDVR